MENAMMGSIAFGPAITNPLKLAGISAVGNDHALALTPAERALLVRLINIEVTYAENLPLHEGQEETDDWVRELRAIAEKLA